MKKLGTLAFLSLTYVVMFLLSACNVPVSPNAASQSLLASTGSSSQSQPSLSTSCPAPGTGRAAVMPPLTLGNDQNIVYFVDHFNSPTSLLSGVLKRYDTHTKATTKILSLSNKNFYSAQVSADGQWVLFVTQPGSSTGQHKLQLVRMDGQDLQTLYCNSTGIDQVQWSTDQKHIVFEEFTSTSELIKLFTTSTGVVQTLLTQPSSNAVIVRTWLDLHRIYLTNTQIDAPPNTIYLLDINNPGTLITVFNGSFSDFDSSFDATKLFISDCVCGRGNSGPSTITVQPATGGQQQTIYSNANDAINSVRAVLPTKLLFTVSNFTLGGGGDMTHNGLWRINTDGTGLARLTTNKSGQFTGFNQFSQFPWSNVSRDGSMYAVQVVGTQFQALFVGPMSGGTPTKFASFTGSGTGFGLVGWTKM